MLTINETTTKVNLQCLYLYTTFNSKGNTGSPTCKLNFILLHDTIVTWTLVSGYISS